MYGIEDHKTASSQSVVGEDLDAWSAKGGVVGAARCVVYFDNGVSCIVDEGKVHLRGLNLRLEQNISHVAVDIIAILVRESRETRDCQVFRKRSTK